MKDGWKCPECGQVYAPWVDKCEYCKNKYLTSFKPYTVTNRCVMCGQHHELGIQCPDTQWYSSDKITVT